MEQACSGLHGIVPFCSQKLNQWWREQIRFAQVWSTSQPLRHALPSTNSLAKWEEKSTGLLCMPAALDSCLTALCPAMA